MPRPAPAAMQNLLRIAEAAEKLGVSPSTVRRLIAMGELPAYRILRGVLLRPEDLEVFLERARIPIRPSRRVALFVSGETDYKRAVTAACALALATTKGKPGRRGR